MTREEAIEKIGHIIDCLELGIYCGEDAEVFEALDLAISALCPISREQVEKVWKGEWMLPIFVGQNDANDPRCQCSECGSIETPLARHRFCPNCGAAMTDEAVQMVMERLETLNEDIC